MYKQRAISYLAMLILIALLAVPSWIGPLPVGAQNSRVTATGKAQENKVKQIAIATPERAKDYGWNQQGVKAARQVAHAIGAKLVVADGIGYANTEPVLRQLATGGANFIIAQASGYNTIAPRIATQYNVPVITYDNPHDLKKGLVSDIETSSQQGAYLAGVLAAKMTKTGTLGIVISAADTNWYKQTGGFVAGARSVNRHVKFLFAQIGQAAYDDAAGGKRVAQSVISGGADIVFGMGDGASFGYLQAVETAKVGHKVWFIDVIGNKTPIDKHHVLLSSVLWNFEPIFMRAVRDINNGTYGTHIYNLNDSDGIALLKTPYIPKGVWKLIERDRKAIVAGKIKVPLTPTAAKVHQILGK
jgi:basic membrane protein A